MKTLDTTSTGLNVKVDGSGRVTDRNRQFLRQFTPATPVQPGPRPGTAGNSYYPEPVVEPGQTPPAVVIDPEPVVQPQIPEPSAQPQTPERSAPDLGAPASPQTPESPSFVTPPTSPVMNFPRRSSRVSRPPDKLSYDNLGGTS